MGAIFFTLTLLLSTLSLISAQNDIASVLNNSDCNTFSSLITKTGVIKSYLTAEKIRGGLTLFAPSNDAFKEQKLPDISNLTNAELVSLLNYHAIPIYASKEILKNMTKDRIKTLASNFVDSFDLTVRIDGDGNLTVNTGVNIGRMVAVAMDEAPICVFVMDRVLLPVDIYGNATGSGPAQAPDGPKAKAPAPSKKNGAGDAEASGNIRAIFVAVSAFVMVFFF